jgi:hypothetical protein
MKTIKETKQIYVAQNQEIEMFETIDGKKFKSEKEAIEHEEIIIKRKILEDKYKMKKIEVEDYGLYYSDSLNSSKLLFIEELNDETKKDLIYLYPYLGYEKSKFNDIKSGWNFFLETEYDSNSLSRWGGYDLYIYNLKNIIKEKENQLMKLNEIK